MSRVLYGVMDFSDPTLHKPKKLQKIRKGKVLNAVLSVYENHEMLKADGNPGSFRDSNYLTDCIKTYLDQFDLLILFPFLVRHFEFF